MTTRRRHIAHLHLHAPLSEEQLDGIVELLSGVTPHVHALPPCAVQLDLTSALRYFDLSPYDVVQLAKMRLKALHGIDCSAGLAGNRMLAAMAADTSAPGDTTWVTEEQAAAWLRPRPVTALPGVGRSTAETLTKYGLYTIGQVADLPAPTLQRLLGAGQARLLAERARGLDPRPVVPKEPAAHLTADVVLDRDCLDPVQHHRAVLELAERIGQRLRGENQVTSRLTLTVRYADRSSTTRTRAPAEPTSHSAALTADALGLLAGLGLQRARVRAFALRADGLSPADGAYRQLSLNPGDERAHAVEKAADRARRRFGPWAVYPAALATTSPAARGAAAPVVRGAASSAARGAARGATRILSTERAARAPNRRR
ncbi:ImpB/MucB/SamB family protein [Streptomyces sp. NPDC058657]|uniref:DNA polymerase Y family protein n=1 Tax=unclassified Streptomyces TaxID=2593676 RepID=UPI00364F99D2